MDLGLGGGEHFRSQVQVIGASLTPLRQCAPLQLQLLACCYEIYHMEEFPLDKGPS